MKIINIRGMREEGGLQHQHLTAVHAAAEVCHADVKGATLHNKELEFSPKKIQGGAYTFDIGTAGSTFLVLQTMLPILFYAERPSQLTLIGGTDNPQAPGSMHFTHVFNHTLNTQVFGVRKEEEMKSKVEIVAHGFYPRGGGRVKAEVIPVKKFLQVDLRERGSYKKTDLHAVATEDLKERNVAERMIEGFKKEVNESSVAEHITYVPSLSTGCFLHAHLHYEQMKVGDDVLGERGKQAEQIGKELAQKINKLKEGEGLDPYAADQIMIYLALAGKGMMKTTKITDHIYTHAAVIEKFLDVKFDVKEETNVIACGPVV